MLRTRWTAIAVSLVIGSAFACPAHAAKPAQASKPQGDYFSAGIPSNSAMQGEVSALKKQATQWFEKFDETVCSYRLTDSEHVVLSRSFKQEAERVREWTNVATKVAKRYRALVMTLKATPVPGSLPELKQLRDSTSDWYSDAADIYEDLTKPRPPAKTMEELDELLDDIKSRAQTLSTQFNNIKSLDMTTRSKYGVHQAFANDALRKYVRTKL